jgi:hypothetical protein
MAIRPIRPIRQIRALLDTRPAGMRVEAGFLERETR